MNTSESGFTGFAALGLHPLLLSALSELGYEEPTPIQRAAIPPLLAGRDLLGQAATGTGKTAAFALPLLHALGLGPLQRGDGRPPVALVLVPTRELAIQVAQATHRYGKALGVSVLPVYGGQPIPQQLRALRRGVDVVIATPGRALDHIRRGTLDTSQVRTLVLDEADEMLDMGFADDLEAILLATPPGRQTALFSATLPARIAAIAQRHLRDPAQVQIAQERAQAGALPRVRQIAFFVPRAHKLAALDRVLDMEAPTSALVFCRTRIEVDELVETLAARGYQAAALHGGMSQEQRDRVMGQFRSGAADLLVATDVAARGLDIDHLSHVVNFDVPCDPDDYIHRIGRTGRAGRCGVAITLAEPRERRLLRNIEQATRQPIEIATVPSVADLRARRLELLRGSLREGLLAGELAPFRAIVESLAQEFDVVDVAAAAARLVYCATRQARGQDAEVEIPSVPPLPPPRHRERDRPPRKELRPRRGDPSHQVSRIFISVGRRVGVRPNDLVGAIANEAGINARVIGAIEIADRFSLVEVPTAFAPEIMEALRRTRIKGKRVVVHQEGEDAPDAR